MDGCRENVKGHNNCQEVYYIHANAWVERKKEPFVTRKKKTDWDGRFTKHIALANRPNTQGFFAFTKNYLISYGDCRDMTKRFERCQTEKKR